MVERSEEGSQKGDKIMTKYNELQVESHKNRKRVGRGIAAGQGKTAGRGTKGQGARTGKKLNASFQGGQRALVQAVPKHKGFKSMRTPAQIVYLDHLNAFKGKTADNSTLFEQGYVATPFHTVKVIARGELTEKVTLKVQAASKSVQAAVTKAGGTFEKVPTPLRKSMKEAKKTDK